MPPRSLRLVALLGLAAIALAGIPARAEKADRFAPLKTESDLPGKIDLLNQVVTLSGNVVVTKGTIVIHAARIEVRQSPDGYHTAIAFGTPAQHATFRQKRDEPNEWIEGDAERSSSTTRQVRRRPLRQQRLVAFAARRGNGQRGHRQPDHL